MSDSARASLEAALGRFVVPHTARPLGGPGATFDLERRGEVWHVTIRLGFPLGASGETLIEGLRVHCAPVLEGAPIEFSIVSTIVAHAVQHGLKPLPGAHESPKPAMASPFLHVVSKLAPPTTLYLLVPI